MDSFVEEFLPEHADGQVARVLGRFAIVAAAGELAVKTSILPWEPGTAKRAAGYAFQSWLNHRGGLQSDELIQGLIKVRKFIETNGDSRFVRMAKVKGKWTETSSDNDFDSLDNHVRDRAGFKYLNVEDHWVYLIFTQAWTEICSGFDARMIADELARQGHMRTDKSGKNSVTRTLPQIGATRVYELRASILSQSVDD